eukprot:TRINITY_DN5245_c3_g1_i1.p1 TRINITY_DN5245_c3_g1~~TRINITY_DN5245_c3_g1_i1.p1  ORF type:complete len:878 (+),score=432.37 TRINITY_DN5245_c3_g1_i1:43-2634(+)
MPKLFAAKAVPKEIVVGIYNSQAEALCNGVLTLNGLAHPLLDERLEEGESQTIDAELTSSKVTGRLSFEGRDCLEFTVDTEKHIVDIKHKVVRRDQVWLGVAEPTGRDEYHVTFHLMHGSVDEINKHVCDIRDSGHCVVDDEEQAFASVETPRRFFAAAPKAPVNARSYAPYEFPEEKRPEVMKRSNSAFCFSGGGARAYTASWGQFRAMHQLQMFDKIRYLSCVSGGNWACSVLVLRDRKKFPIDDFLGQFLYGPGQNSEGKLTMCRLKTFSDKSMGRPARSSRDLPFASHLLRNMSSLTSRGKGNTSDFWNLTVAERFLKPYGVESEKPMSWNLETIQDLIDENPHMRCEDFQLQDSAMPFLVINSLLMAPYEHTPIPVSRLSRQMLVFESTPLACGIPTPPHPVQFCKATEKWYSRVSDWVWGDDDGEDDMEKRLVSVGGGLIQNIGHNGAFLSENIDQRDTEDEVVQVKRHYSVRDAVGNSSTCYAGYVAAHFPTFAPKNQYEPLVQDSKPAPGEDREANIDDFFGKKWVFGDAGLADNFGLISMLRRKVEHIVVFVNTSMPLSCTKWDDDQSLITKQMLDNSKVEPPRDASGELMIDNTLTGFFGWTTPSSEEGITENLQCFNRKDFWPVVDQLQKSALAHEPTVAQSDNITVKPNAFHGVEAYTCNVTWVYLTKQHCLGMGAKDLPKEVLRKVGFNKFMGDDTYNKYVDTKDKYFTDFPNYATAMHDKVPVLNGLFSIPVSMVGYDRVEVSLLAEYTCWALHTWFTKNAKGRVVYERITGEAPPTASEAEAAAEKLFTAAPAPQAAKPAKKTTTTRRAPKRKAAAATPAPEEVQAQAPPKMRRVVRRVMVVRKATKK